MNSINIFCTDGTRINVGRGVTKETETNYIHLSIINREDVEISENFWGGDLSCMESFINDNIENGDEYIDDVIESCWKHIVL